MQDVDSARDLTIAQKIAEAQKQKESKNWETKKFKSYSAHKPSVEVSISEQFHWS